MLLGYNTNGLAHHDLESALELLAEIGYQSVAITLDHGVLDPFERDWLEEVQRVRRRLRQLGLASVVETGARYLLDPTTKHEPTLVSADAAERCRRVLFLQRAIDTAAALESGCVSLWAGIVRDAAAEATVWDRLTSGLHDVLDHAERCGVDIGFEPEPGMFVDTMSRFAQLIERLPHPRLKLTLDVGHLHCQGETPLADHIRARSATLANVHIEDMRRGVHEHLMFGEGQIDFPPVLAALADVGYRGGLHVELSRHGHEGPSAARRAYEFLRPLLSNGE